VDLEIHLNFPEFGRLVRGRQSLHFQSPYSSSRGKPILKLWRLEVGFRFEYHDGVEFIVDRAGTRVWAKAQAEAAPEDLAVYLLGPILGFVLRLQGITCLHASAVLADNWALAFLGPPGAGKSTLAAAMSQKGHPVLCDDLVPLREADGRVQAGPGSPRVCLWPDAVAHLYGSPEALPRLTPENALDPDWDKRWLDLSCLGPQAILKSAPLGAVYFLGQRQHSSEFRVDPIPSGPGLIMLVANAYRTELLDKDLRAQEFATLARLAARVPLRRLTPPAAPARLPGFCEAILADFRGLARPQTRQTTALEVA
jgi:hypothetical protein